MNGQQVYEKVLNITNHQGSANQNHNEILPHTCQEVYHLFKTNLKFSVKLQHTKISYRDFLSGPVVKNLPSNAGDLGSIPGRGTKIPHAKGQLSPCTTTTELSRLNERARVPQTTEPTHSGAHTPQLQSPRTLERENLHTTTRERPVHHNKEPTHRNKKDPAYLNEDPTCCK